MIKYKVTPDHFEWKPEIVAVECERETASCVYINGRRNAKRSGYENYCDTWEEAYNMLCQHAEIRTERIRGQLKMHEEAMARILEMKKPE